MDSSIREGHWWAYYFDGEAPGVRIQERGQGKLFGEAEGCEDAYSCPS